MPEPSVEERIEAAVADYRSVWPEPHPLSPNLELAVEAMEKGLETNQWASEVSDEADRLIVHVERMEETLGLVRALADQWGASDARYEYDLPWAARQLRKALGVD